MSVNSYQEYHLRLLNQLAKDIKSTSPFNSDISDELQVQFLEKLDAMLIQTNHDDLLADGQWLIEKIVANYQIVMPMVPRDLFWYFGGDSLHFLGDEEIALFQRIDETFHRQLSQGEQGTDYAAIASAIKDQQ